MLFRFLYLGLLLPLAACSLLPPSADKAAASTDVSPWAIASRCDGHGAKGLAWQHMPLPGKQATDYVYTRLDGRDAMAARAESSASLLRQKLRIEPQHLGLLKFSWKVPQLIADADLAHRDKSDSPVRLILAFEGDRSGFSMKNAMLSELSRAITGEPMPYATLIYVWCNQCPRESVIHSTRTDRIRKLVLESGSTRLNQWLDYERDIRADFIKAFGEPPGALVGIAIMTDTDNTRSSARAWYGPVQLGDSLLAKK